MKLDERNLNTQHVTGMLDGMPLASASVADARSALEKATSALTVARVDELDKKQATEVAAALVRDATAKTFDECHRATGLLAAKGMEESLVSAMRGRRTRPVLARSEFLLEQGLQAGVPLGTLAADRKELADAASAYEIAREQKKAAHEARLDAERTWDAAYAALHGAVEAVLAGRGLRGRKLLAAVQVYFTPQSRAQQPATPTDPGTKPEEKKTPA